MRALRRSKFLLGLAFVLAACVARAETYPDHAIHMIVPFPAGTATDVIARSVARGLEKSLGTIVIDNKGGALGTIATADAARAKPDGYTLLLGSTTSMSAGPQMLRNKPPYDSQADFIPLGRIAGTVFTLVVRPDLGVNTAEEFVALARKRSKPLSYGYANSANLAACGVLAKEAGFQALRVPYKGVPQMMQDLLGGTIDFTIVDLANALPQIKAGKLKPLAISTPKEIPELPGVPPIGRVAKGFQLMVWTGLFVPKGTPEPIAAILADKLKVAMNDPEVKKALTNTGNLLFYGDAKEMRAYLAEDTARWAGLIKAAEIPVE